jgi:ABC-type dipeptide/oligopeptide/nickel transport system permease component
MPGSSHKPRTPRLTMALARALLVTFLLMLLSFAISLLLAIGSLMITAAAKGGHVDMTFAYRHIAAPVAMVVGLIVLALSLTMEIRHYRQAKALISIERAG